MKIITTTILIAIIYQAPGSKAFKLKEIAMQKIAVNRIPQK